MENVITLFQRVTTAPEQLNSVSEFLIAFVLLLLASLLVAVPSAILAKILLEREKLGTATRLLLAIGRTALAVGVLALIDAVVLVALDRAPHWTAVAPQCALAIVAGLWALLQYHSVNHELTQMRRHVDSAKRQAA
jgi:hypothetical protein